MLEVGRRDHRRVDTCQRGLLSLGWGPRWRCCLRLPPLSLRGCKLGRAQANRVRIRSGDMFARDIVDDDGIPYPSGLSCEPHHSGVARGRSGSSARQRLRRGG
jgi:hypothetical protein